MLWGRCYYFLNTNSVNSKGQQTSILKTLGLFLVVLSQDNHVKKIIWLLANNLFPQKTNCSIGFLQVLVASVVSSTDLNISNGNSKNWLIIYRTLVRTFICTFWSYRHLHTWYISTRLQSANVRFLYHESKLRLYFNKCRLSGINFTSVWPRLLCPSARLHSICPQPFNSQRPLTVSAGGAAHPPNTHRMFAVSQAPN